MKTTKSIKKNRKKKLYRYFELQTGNVANKINSIFYLPNPSARAGYDTRSIFKRSLTALNSEFSSPRLVASPRLKNPVCP